MLGMQRSLATLARVGHRRLLLMATAVCGLLVLAWLAPPLERPLDEPCPAGSRTEHPARVQLSVTVLEHQSWVQVPAAEVSVGLHLVACTDGKAIGSRDVQQRDIQNDAVRIGVPTRWVLGQWLAGDLDPYRPADRWTVVFPA
jgi:hypothetical protein